MTKTVLITGASRGLGMHSAVELARRNWRVFAGVRSIDRSPALDAVCAGMEGKIEKISLDVTRADSVSAAIAEIRSAGHTIDVVVNNAGVGCAGFFEQLSKSEFDSVMQTNFAGTVEVIRSVLPEMRKRRCGTIINVSSMYGFMGCPMHSVYAASKWAMEGFSESLRFEMEPFGIYVALIEPGFFLTELLNEKNAGAEQMNDPSSPYSSAVVEMLNWFRQSVAPYAGDVNTVARLVADIAEHKRPRLRYVVGKDSRLLRLLRAIVPLSAVYGVATRRIARALKYS